MGKSFLAVCFIMLIVGFLMGVAIGKLLNITPLTEKGECIGWCRAHRWETGEFSAGDCWCVRKNEKRLKNAKGECK